MEGPEVSGPAHAPRAASPGEAHFSEGVLLQAVRFCCTWSSPGPVFPPPLTAGAFVHSVGLDKCVMTRVPPHSVPQSDFTAMNVLWVSPGQRSLSPPLATADPSIIAMVLLSSSVTELVTQSAAFSDWLLSLCNKHSKFSPVFHGLVAHLFVP